MDNIARSNIKLFDGCVSDFNVRYLHVLRAIVHLLLDVQVYEWCDIKPEIFAYDVTIGGESLFYF